MIRPSFFAVVSCAGLLLAGCGTGPQPSAVSNPVTIGSGAVQGVFMGGQQPVGGVSLQLYAAGNSGYGSAATPLLPAGSVKTTAYGNFTLPSFTCPSASALVYLVGTGGQPIAATGSTAAVTNNNLAMMAGLGACSTVGSTFINVNEVTTVASVWALAPFMTGIANVGTSATNPTGLALAFASINKLAYIAIGRVSGPALPANAVLPIAEINTLADILEQCVNSGGGAASDTTDGQTNGTGCGKLFYLTTTGSSVPTDTITAALNIAQNPTQNVAKLNRLRSASPVFRPAMSVNGAPNDWTIAIQYSGGGLSSPQGIASDQQGNVWVANAGNSSVTQLSPTGLALSPDSGFTAGGISTPYALAVDQSGSVWVANSGSNSVTKLTNGTTGTNYTGNGLNAPKGIAIDGYGNVLVTNSGSSTVSAFSPSGTALSGSPYAGGGVSQPAALAVSPR